jgi:hypothetical protein
MPSMLRNKGFPGEKTLCNRWREVSGGWDEDRGGAYLQERPNEQMSNQGRVDPKGQFRVPQPPWFLLIPSPVLFPAISPL